MEGGTAVVLLVASILLTVGVSASFPSAVNIWTPAPRPFIERVLLVGGDLVVDVRNPSDRLLECAVYNSGVVLAGPRTIGPGKVATYTGPASGRDVRVECTQGSVKVSDARIAHQVAGSGAGSGSNDSGVAGGSGSDSGSGSNSAGSGGGGDGPELRHFSCEVRRVGNRNVVRLHANLEAVVNRGAKPYNFTVDFGDGVVEMSLQNGSAYTTNHVYGGMGPYTARLTVTDALGRAVEQQLEVPGGCRNA